MALDVVVGIAALLAAGQPAGDVVGERFGRYLQAFAADVGGGDAEVAERARRAIANPEREPAAVGFYLEGDEPPEEIAFRTVVTALVRSGHVLEFGAVYLNELPAALVAELLGSETGNPMPAAAAAFFEELSVRAPSGGFEATERDFERWTRELQARAERRGV